MDYKQPKQKNILSVIVSKDEKLKIEEYAKHKSLSTSSLLRSSILEKIKGEINRDNEIH